MVQELNSLQDFENAINYNTLCVVFFFAKWCGPCKMIEPLFEEYAINFESKMAFFKVDVDINEDIEDNQNIFAMPTFRFYEDGQKREELVGANRIKLLDLIKNAVS